MDDDEFEEIYEPVGSASDSNEDIRVSRIQLSVVNVFMLHLGMRIGVG